MASTRLPLGVKYGLPDSSHCKSYLTSCLSRIAWTLSFNSCSVLAVEKRKLNRISTVPGTTLVAPVPPLMLETCQEVGGKYSLPLSQVVPANSAIAGAAI